MVTTAVVNEAERSPSPAAATTEAAAAVTLSLAKTSIDPPNPIDSVEKSTNDLPNAHTEDSINGNSINTANTLNGTGGQNVILRSKENDNVKKSDEILQENAKQLPKSSTSVEKPGPASAPTPALSTQTPPQIIIEPPSVKTPTTGPAGTSSTAKKIRRAFSMPRNPFRWSHSKFKTSGTLDAGGGEGGGGGGGGGVLSLGKSYTLTSCVGGNRERSGSFISLNSNEGGGGVTIQDSKLKANAKEKEKQSTDGARKMKVKSNTLNGDISKLEGSNNGSGVVNNSQRLFRRSSFRKFINRITQHMTNTSNKPPHLNSTTANATATTNGGHSISSNGDRVPPIGGYQWPTDQTPGVMGLKNHGNTCFMNAVLQCLSHTDILAEYFVLDQYKADLKRRNKINSRKFGTKGELTEQLANVLKALWTCKNESDHSTSFKAVVDRYGSQFRSSTQHDAQEFLFWLLDKVHEDLNTATKRRYKSVKNNYGRPDEVIAAETLANHIRCNNSFVQAVFQAQFRSSLTCPRCKKQSNTFDPFHCISVQLPQLTQQTIFVTVVYLQKQPRQVRMGLTVTAGSPIVALREQLHKDTGIRTDQMVLVDLQKEGFTRVFYDSQPVNTLQGIETIYCIEVPLEKEEMGATTSKSTTTTSSSATAAVSVASTSKANGESNGTSNTTSNTATSTTTTTANNPQSSDLLVLVTNVKKTITKKKEGENEKEENSVQKDEITLEKFGAPFCLRIPRDCSYNELQKKLLKEMSAILKPEVFSYATPLKEMFQIRLQDPSADPDTFIEQVEHPLLTEMIDLALSVLSSEAGPAHIKLLLEWPDPEAHFSDLSDQVVEHESVPQLMANKTNDTATLTLEQCLEHYTKAETLSAEDAWRCPHCQEYLPVVKTLGLWSLPDILVVHFKRFRQHQGKETNAAKLTTMVKFPLHSFDMSPHLAKDSNGATTSLLTENNLLTSQTTRPSPWRKSKSGDSRSSTLSSRDNRETRYDLYAVCYHQGDTLETGHYTAACKNPYDRAWYKFDDQRVNKVPNEALPDEIVNNEAYMLFYQRRTSDNVECSGSSSNSSDHWISRIAPPPPLSVNTGGSNSLSSEKLLKEEVKDVKEEEEPLETKVVQKMLSKEIKDNKPENQNEMEIKENGLIEPEKPVTLTKNEQTSSNANSLDAIEQTLDYADAEEISESKDIVIKSEKPLEENIEIFTMDEDCKLEEEEENEDNNKTNQSIIDSNKEIMDNLNKPQCNGFNDKDIIRTKSPLGIKETNGPAKSPISMSSNRKSSSSSSTSSSSSSLVSKSPMKSPSKSNTNKTEQQKFNGFSSQTSVPNDKESSSSTSHHPLSTSLKSNSSSIISSAVAGHFQSFGQPWHGSRSSVSAVENTTNSHNSSATSAVTSHPSLHLRHSFSTASNYRLRECNETLSSVLRNSVNTCSKDTLMFLDQQQHHNHHHHHPHHHNHHHHQRHHHSLMEDDDDSTFIGSRSLWISPVTPHKLITVSPKN